MYFDNIPQQLQQLNRWVCWVIEDRDGKPAKVPKNPNTGGNAMANNPDTWGSFQAALNRYQSGEVRGIGFMLGEGIVGVDIDHCRDPETGVLSDEAIDIIKTIDSYTEISQSGTGIHILCIGNLPAKGRRKGPVEMYQVGRYFIMTGNVYASKTQLQERSEALATVHRKYIAPQEKKNASQPMQQQVETRLDDDELIEKAMAAKNGKLFIDLMNGITTGYNSQSEADLALCNILAFWTGKDYDQMDRIFRRSGLYREKWDEIRGGVSYGAMTLETAIAGVDKVYTPEKPKAKAQDVDINSIDNGFEQLVQAADNELPDWILGPYNDSWNAERYIEYTGNDIKYNTGKGTWFIWNGKYWAEDRLGSARMLIDDTVSWLETYIPKMAQRYGTDDKRYKEYKSWLTKMRNTNRKDNTLKEASYWTGISTLPEAFDRDPWLFNCQNGTVNLKTGELQPHQREDLITRMSPAAYDPNAKAPIFEAFLNRIFNNKKHLIEFIQRAIGYSMTGSTQEQCIFVCHGSGANGKSTLIGVMQELMGEYTRNTNFTTFTVRNDSNTNDIARLVGARFVTAMEVGEDKRLNEALIKQLTGGDKISARYLHKEFFDFYPTFKIWMGANHKPNIKETDNGIWRRIKLIPFEVTIPQEERDPELPSKLQAELPGILAWAVKGCLSWRKQGLNPPPEVDAATNEYRSEMDRLQLFLDECTEPDEKSNIRSNDLYAVYEKWCIINGERQLSSVKFSIKLKERGIEKGRTRVVRTWERIKLTKYGRQLLAGVTSVTSVTGFTEVEKEQDFPAEWKT